MPIRKKLGEVLIEAGLITQEQLDQALLLQKGKNKRLGKILIEMGCVNENQIAEALSKQLNLPLVDCSKYTITKELISLISKDIAEKKILIPLEQTDKKLLVAMADPLDWACIDELAFKTGLKIRVAVASETSIVEAIEKAYLTDKENSWDFLAEIPSYEGAEIIKETMEDQKEVNVQSLYSLSEAPPIVKLVTMILVDAVRSRATDIHIEPQEKHVQVRYRVDGDLRNVLKYPKHIQESVTSRIKIIANLDITNRRTPQDGRSTLLLKNTTIDLRISSLPAVYGENIVIRLLDRTTGLISLSKLGMPENILTPLLKLASKPQGMILVTGPTGSGKSTTLYALIQQLRTETESIFTIEDPVEYKIPGITQVAVNEAIGLSFANALRSILRQDPDIILIGEIRDKETAEIAVRSALTGHLVLTTIHTNDTIATITRLLDMGLDPYLITSAVTGVLAQRLVRQICPKCKTATTPPIEEKESVSPSLKTYYHGKGCSYCQYTGYRGQVGVYEFLQMDTRLKRLISKGASEEELWQAARETGITTLFEDAWSKVNDGTTTIDEILAKIPYRDFNGLSYKSDNGQKPKILFVRVAEPNNYIIRTTFEPEGYEIAFSSEEDLLKIATRENPDLIVTGFFEGLISNLKSLRSNIRYAYTPVFVLSDTVDIDSESKALKLGVKEFFHGSIDAEKLLTIVNSELKNR